MIRSFVLWFLRFLIKYQNLRVHKVANYVNVILSNTKEYYKYIDKYTNTDTIIDVGVHEGTEELYEAFSNKFFLLVDPVDNLIKKKPNNFNFIKKGLGSKIEFKKFNFHKNSGMSSFKEEIKVGRNIESEPISSTDIEVITLDQLIEDELKNTKNIGIKIDAQGSEADILQGLNKNIEKVQFIIIEMNIFHRYKNSKTFSEITSLLLKKDFYFFNFITPSSAIPRYAHDCVFLKKDNTIFNSK